MRRLLLATTAITALALAPALAVAQVQSNGPSGAVQEQPGKQEPNAPKGGKPVPVKPGPSAPGKSAQTQTPPATQQQPQHQQRTQGQAQPQLQQPGGQPHLQGQAPQQGAPQQRAQNQPQPPATGAQQQQRSTGTASTQGSGRAAQVHVTEQQRTQIHERLAHTRVDRIEHPQFSVSVGAEIPRSVHVEVVPPEIVEVVPEYQGFDYVMVGDEILIVDPDSLQIVAVIPV